VMTGDKSSADGFKSGWGGGKNMLLNFSRGEGDGVLLL